MSGNAETPPTSDLPSLVEGTASKAGPTDAVPLVVEPLPSFDETEIGLVRRFWLVHRDRFKFLYEEDLPLAWSDGVWDRDTTGMLIRTMSDFLTVIIRDDILRAQKRLENEGGNEDDEQGTKAVLARLRKWERWAGSEYGLRNALKLYANLPGITVHETDLDANGFLLAFENGTLDLVDFKFRESDPKDLITKQLPYAFDSNARCPRFLRFLEEVQPDPEIREYLGRVAGRCLVSNAERRRIILNFGQGSNGKSVFQETLREALGPYGISMNIETFLDRRSDQAQYDLARARGARLVTVDELPEDRRFDDAMLKAVTGGDRIRARHIYREPFDYTPGFQVLIATNSHPILNDTKAAIDRYITVPWLVRVPEERWDRGLELRLTHRVNGELPGILNWAVSGLKRWKLGRLKELDPPPIIANYTRSVRDESVPFSAFIEEVLERGDDDHYVPSSWGLAVYNYWARRQGMKETSASWLGRALGQRGIERERFGSANVCGYRGWKVRLEYIVAIKNFIERFPDAAGPGDQETKDVNVAAGCLPDPARIKVRPTDRDVM